jgi:peptide methionine sulfoxide reductase msrA/msrB
VDDPTAFFALPFSDSLRAGHTAFAGRLVLDTPFSTIHPAAMRDLRKQSVFTLPLALVLAAFVAFGCAEPQAATQTSDRASLTAPVPDSLRQATFAGGCFWCTEAAFQKLDGVTRAVSGFSGGTTPDPTYNAVASGRTDYAEGVQVTYDPDEITYEGLLAAYWHHMDPTDAGGQFADRGSQYRPVIFYHNERQQRLARQSKKALAESDTFSEPIAVKIESFERFYVAETYHQDYFEKHPAEYKRYYEGSGRGPFVRETWGGETASRSTGTETTAASGAASGPSAPSVVTQQAASARTAPPWADFEMPSDAQLREMLTDLEYRVTQQNGTERTFSSDLTDNKRPGIYVDIVSGEPLYSSKHKFHSGTGWPSFYRSIDDEYIVQKEDRTMGMVRTEVRSKLADSHLGHIFEWNRSPEVPTGKRHCINGVALEFIPADELEERGYGMYAGNFE